MKASKAVKITDLVMLAFNGFAHQAQGWNIEDEDDYEELKETVLDIIASGKYEPEE